MLDRLPIRWRLALLSAGLTFAILCTFAIAVGEMTHRQIQADFREQVREAADKVERSIGAVPYDRGRVRIDQRTLDLVAGAENGVLRIVDQSGELLADTPGAPNFGGPPFPRVPEVLPG